MSSRRNIVESALLERASLHAGHSYNSQNIRLRPVVAQAQNYQLQQAKGIHTFFPIERSKPTVLDTSNGLLPKGLCTYLCMCVCTYICIYLYEYVCACFARRPKKAVFRAKKAVLSSFAFAVFTKNKTAQNCFLAQQNCSKLLFWIFQKIPAFSINTW